MPTACNGSGWTGSVKPGRRDILHVRPGPRWSCPSGSAPPGTLIERLDLRPEFGRPSDPIVDAGEVTSCDDAGLGARPLGMEGAIEPRPDRIHLESEITRLTDETSAPDRVLVGGPTIGPRRLRHRQQSDGTTEADGRDLEPRPLGQQPDGERTRRTSVMLEWLETSGLTRRTGKAGGKAIHRSCCTLSRSGRGDQPRLASRPCRIASCAVRDTFSHPSTPEADGSENGEKVSRLGSLPVEFFSTQSRARPAPVVT